MNSPINLQVDLGGDVISKKHEWNIYYREYQNQQILCW